VASGRKRRADIPTFAPKLANVLFLEPIELPHLAQLAPDLAV
jgi:hypothetical protein